MRGAVGDTIDCTDHVSAYLTQQSAGEANGADLVRVVSLGFPEVVVVVTSGASCGFEGLPAGVRLLATPWQPLDMLTAMQGAAA